MLGLDYPELCLSFDAVFYDIVATMREDHDKMEEILEVQGDEFPEDKKTLQKTIEELGKLNLSTDEMIGACFLTALKVIEINNLAIHKQLEKAGLFL